MTLYVLNLSNYSQNPENFKNNFKQYKNKTINELLSNDSLKALLKNLDINPEEITEKDNVEFGKMDSILKDNIDNISMEGSRHPYYFYLEDKKFDVLKKYYDYLQKKEKD